MAKFLKEIFTPRTHPITKALRKRSNHWGEEGDKINAQLSGTGAKVVGSGAFGAVALHPHKNVAYKIYKDQAYDKFAHYAAANQNSDPHLPKIHALGKLKGSSHFRVAKMEKLEPLAQDHPVRKHLFTYNKYYSNNSRPEYDGPSDQVEEKLTKTEHGRKFAAAYPSVHKSLLNIVRNHRDHWFDLHDQNIMQRKDGTPVITDPVVSN